MKLTIKNLVIAIFDGLAVFIVLPFAAVWLNDYLGLPRFDLIVIKLLGFLLIVGGISLVIYCYSLFPKLGAGTPAPMQPAQKLISAKIYQYSRNPIYVGYLAILLGEVFLLGRSLLLVYWLAILLFLNYYMRVVEEPKLKQRFGKKYLQYFKQVPRWF